MSTAPWKRERFWCRVDKQAGGCWLWKGCVDKRTGYGKCWYRNQDYRAHRAAYEMLIGPIPDGLTLDHLCRNRACVNPAHLEPVTFRANTLRGEGPSAKNAHKTHCPRGHAYEGSNLQLLFDGSRRCRICGNAQALAVYHRRRQRARLGVDCTR